MKTEQRGIISICIITNPVVAVDRYVIAKTPPPLLAERVPKGGGQLEAHCPFEKDEVNGVISFRRMRSRFFRRPCGRS
jgi:hypothetical protein